MIHILDLKIIQYIKTIEEEGSFQKAAEALYISQPALSQYIKRVEQELDFPLYDRKLGKCTLTKSGKVLLQQGSLLLEDYYLMLNEMRKAADISKVTFSFGCPTGYSVPFFSEFLFNSRSSEKYEFKMVEDSVEYLLNMLLKRKLDILFIPAVFHHPEVIYHTICHEEYYLAIPQNHPLNKKAAVLQENGYISLSSLGEIPFISGPAKAYTEFLRPIFEEPGVRINTIFVAKNWDIAHSLVEKGVGLTIVPYWFTHTTNEHVSYYKISSRHNTHRIFAYAMRTNQKINEPMQKTIDYIINKCGDEFADMLVPADQLLLKFYSNPSITHKQEE